jgi:hypothetical protein
VSGNGGSEYRWKRVVCYSRSWKITATAMGVRCCDKSRLEGGCEYREVNLMHYTNGACG